jgi:hypothetical protein
LNRVDPIGIVTAEGLHCVPAISPWVLYRLSERSIRWKYVVPCCL